MQKGQSLILLLVGILILAGVAGGAYYLGTKKSATLQDTVSKQNPVIFPSTSPQPNNKPTPDTKPQNDETTNWKTYTSEECGISAQYPEQWMIIKSDKINSNNPIYNNPCFVIQSPDYKIYPQSDVNDGVAITIKKMQKGTIYASPVKNISITVNTLGDYIKAENSSVNLSNTNGAIDFVSNVQDKIYGNLNGKYYMTSAMNTNSNFIFASTNNIYSITWPKDYTGIYKDKLESIVSTFKVI